MNHGHQLSQELAAEGESEDAGDLPGQDQEGHLADESIDRRSEEPERGASPPEAGAEESADPSVPDSGRVVGRFRRPPHHRCSGCLYTARRAWFNPETLPFVPGVDTVFETNPRSDEA